MSDPYQRQYPPQQPATSANQYGQQYGPPQGPQYGPPQGPQYGSPQGPQYGSPQGPQYGSPQGPQYGAPQGPQYGAPAQGGAYGSPQGIQYGMPQANQYGATQDAPYGAPPQGTPWNVPQGGEPEKKRNGFAIAALVFGIISWIPFGLGFGIAGLVRAKKVGRGKVMSIVAVVLSVLWIVPYAYVVPHLIKASDPGCIAAKDVIATYDDARMNADSKDPATFKADLATIVSQLNSAAAKSQNGAAQTAIKKLATDFNELLNDINTGHVPDNAMTTRADADANAVDSACGTIGS